MAIKYNVSLEENGIRGRVERDYAPGSSPQGRLSFPDGGTYEFHQSNFGGEPGRTGLTQIRFNNLVNYVLDGLGARGITLDGGFSEAQAQALGLPYAMAIQGLLWAQRAWNLPISVEAAVRSVVRDIHKRSLDVFQSLLTAADNWQAIRLNAISQGSPIGVINNLYAIQAANTVQSLGRQLADTVAAQNAAAESRADVYRQTAEAEADTTPSPAVLAGLALLVVGLLYMMRQRGLI